MDENENISAFAFKTAKIIEEFINTTNNNFEEDYKHLQALVLDFRMKLKYNNFQLLEEYDKHFNIQIQKQGEIKKDK